MNGVKSNLGQNESHSVSDFLLVHVDSFFINLSAFLKNIGIQGLEIILYHSSEIS